MRIHWVIVANVTLETPRFRVASAVVASEP